MLNIYNREDPFLYFYFYESQRHPSNVDTLKILYFICSTP